MAGTPIEDYILSKLETEESVDSLVVCKELEKQYPELIKNHQDLHSFLLQLSSQLIVALENASAQSLELSAEGQLYLELGTPEFHFGTVVKENPTASRNEVNDIFAQKLAEIYGDRLSVKPATLSGPSFAKAKTLGYVGIEKGNLTLGDLSEDKVKTILSNYKDGKEIDAKVLTDLKKRGALAQVTTKWFKIRRGAKYVTKMSLYRKPIAELTEAMVKSGEWENCDFAPLNFEALGAKIASGHEHPLLKVRGEFRQIFLMMGFEEMDTSRWVESSFWNFDSLFQGQQHPCRDLHDTFFLENPEHAHPVKDNEYFQRVKQMHQTGGMGSIGLRYEFDERIPLTNIMRTHTTAVSSRYLKMLADEYKVTGELRPRKFFSIDRVYRNETLDATHLAEFYQCEGFVIDKDLSLGDLMNHIREFFSHVGITDIEFKPAYNPYTEPSMEIFAFHPGLNKHIEIGNSGIFRPEMLNPMGIPEGYNVIAWGFGLERPTMIEYKIEEIRKLEGPNVSLELIENVPICRLSF